MLVPEVTPGRPGIPLLTMAVAVLQKVNLPRSPDATFLQCGHHGDVYLR